MLAGTKKKIDEIGDAIMQLREERQQILTQAAMRKDVKDGSHGVFRCPGQKAH